VSLPTRCSPTESEYTKQSRILVTGSINKAGDEPHLGFTQGVQSGANKAQPETGLETRLKYGSKVLPGDRTRDRTGPRHI